MIKQCKGKDIDNVAQSMLINDGWYLSRKFDGNYVQIHKVGSTVKFFTSGEKEFFIPEVANELVALNPDNSFILECEYIGISEGKLGDRTKACKLTTYRTNFEKRLGTQFDSRERFKAFNIIIENMTFVDREAILDKLKLGNFIEKVIFFGPMTLESAKDTAKEFIKQGFEGVYLTHSTHTYKPGKRVNNAIKIKGRVTADLKCIDIVEGTGKYTGLIGSLVLKDSKGRVVAVGSGLDDNLRNKDKNYFLNKIIEIEYEQIIDTYIQPTFIRIRDDKTKED